MKIKSLLCCLGIFMSACSLAQGPNKVYTFASKPAWADEFDGKGLPDPQRWSYDVGGHGWGNNEKQFYTKEDLDNARQEGGFLVIEARKEAIQGMEYSSARLVTKGKGDFLYGRLEVKAKLPLGLGSWPAIWTLASRTSYGKDYWPDQGEIDIMEHVGYDPGEVHASVHTKRFNHIIGTQKTAKIKVPKVEDFHVYRIDWTPDYIQTFVDGQAYFRFENPKQTWEEWPFDQAQHLLLNIAVGGNWGGAKGLDPSIFPIQMQVDYVRYYPLIETP